MMRAAVLAMLLVACGHGPACPRLNTGGAAPPPPSCQPPPRACAHARRPAVPPPPLLTGFADIDAIRIDGYARTLELWAALDWRACGGAE